MIKEIFKKCLEDEGGLDYRLILINSDKILTNRVTLFIELNINNEDIILTKTNKRLLGYIVLYSLTIASKDMSIFDMGNMVFNPEIMGTNIALTLESDENIDVIKAISILNKIFYTPLTRDDTSKVDIEALESVLYKYKNYKKDIDKFFMGVENDIDFNLNDPYDILKDNDIINKLTKYHELICSFKTNYIVYVNDSTLDSNQLIKHIGYDRRNNIEDLSFHIDPKYPYDEHIVKVSASYKTKSVSYSDDFIRELEVSTSKFAFHIEVPSIVITLLESLLKFSNRMNDEDHLYPCKALLRNTRESISTSYTEYFNKPYLELYFNNVVLYRPVVKNTDLVRHFECLKNINDDEVMGLLRDSFMSLSKNDDFLNIILKEALSSEFMMDLLIEHKDETKVSNILTDNFVNIEYITNLIDDLIKRSINEEYILIKLKQK